MKKHYNNARTNSHEMAGPPTMGGISRMRPGENDPISLDLVVGMSYGVENKTNGKLNMLDYEHVQRQVPVTALGRMVVQASPFSACYGVVNGSMVLYGSQEIFVQGGGFEAAAPLPASNQCPQNLGRILLAP